MNKIILLVALYAIILNNVYAQSPQAFSYQVVARDASGAMLADQSVSFRIGILEGSITGTAIYTETHTSSPTPSGWWTWRSAMEPLLRVCSQTSTGVPMINFFK